MKLSQCLCHEKDRKKRTGFLKDSIKKLNGRAVFLRADVRRPAARRLASLSLLVAARASETIQIAVSNKSS